MVKLKLSPIVSSVHELNFQGNVIPHEWFNHIVNETGKVNLNAIVILSEIVYWYRPVGVYEQGRYIGQKDKFEADMLQKSYQDLAEKFNLSKTQVKRAIDLLIELGVVIREFRNLMIRGQHISNVMFLSLDVEVLKKLTHPHKNEMTSLQKSDDLPPQNIETYTKITTKSTTNNFEEEEALPLPSASHEQLLEQQARKAFQYFEQNIGMLSAVVRDKIDMWLTEFEPTEAGDIICFAIELTAERQKTWPYTNSILLSWAKRNAKTMADVKALKAEHDRQLEQRNGGKANAKHKTSNGTGNATNGTDRASKKPRDYAAKYLPGAGE